MDLECRKLEMVYNKLRKHQLIMKIIDIITNSLYIKETIGFAIFDSIPIEDHPQVIHFCKIIFNYTKMKNIKQS